MGCRSAAISLLLLWVTYFLYGITPEILVHWDLVRCVREWRFYFLWTLYSQEYIGDCVSMANFYIEPEQFPDFSNDPELEVFVVDHSNVTQEILEYTWKYGNAILHWKNVTQGAHEELSLDWLTENLDHDANYEVYGNGKSYHVYGKDKKADNLRSMVNMGYYINNTLKGAHEKYYMGFELTMTEDNPALRIKMETMINNAVRQIAGEGYLSKLTRYAGGFVDLSNVDFFYNAFLYHGTKFWAYWHSAVTDASFLQIHNTKRFVFTHPRYMPYIMPVYHATIDPPALEFTMFDEIPKVMVDVSPGDLLYFPIRWPHAVVNLRDEWGLAIGTRDLHKTAQAVKRAFIGGKLLKDFPFAMYDFVFQEFKRAVYFAIWGYDRGMKVKVTKSFSTFDGEEIKAGEVYLYQRTVHRHYLAPLDDLDNFDSKMRIENDDVLENLVDMYGNAIVTAVQRTEKQKAWHRENYLDLYGKYENLVNPNLEKCGSDLRDTISLKDLEEGEDMSKFPIYCLKSNDSVTTPESSCEVEL